MIVSWDTETEAITEMVKVPRLVCVSCATREAKPGLFAWDDPNARTWVARWLEDHVSTGANIGYDMAVIMRQWPELTPLVFDAYESDRVVDTLVVQKLIDIAHGELHRAPKAIKGSNYSLNALCYRHLDRTLDKAIWDEDPNYYGRLRDVPLAEWDERALAYPVADAVGNLEVHEIQQLGWPDLLKDQYRQSRHAFWLHLVSAHGIVTDPVRVARFKEQLETEQAEKIEILAAHGLIRQQKKKGKLEWVRTVAAARERMATFVPPERLMVTDKGAVCLDEEACSDSGDEVLEAYADYSSLKKRLSADIPHLEKGELHCRFDSLKETGRTGCGEPYNLQNPPRTGGARECVVPRPGYLFADADYDGLESRTGAQACLELVGESTMADVLNAGKDLHIDMAAALLGCTYDECLTRYKAYKKTGNDSEVANARQFAKIANFGLCGGMGEKRFFEHAQKELKKSGARELAASLTLESTREIRNAWLRKWPEWRRYFARGGEFTESGFATAEQLFSGRYRGGLGYSDFLNTYFQGLGADAAKAAGWRVTRACFDWTQGSVLYGSRIVNFVHDQFILEVPIPIAHECAVELGRIMVEEANKWLPDVPAKTTPCLATAWSKDAGDYYDQDKRLIPWSPEGQLVKIWAEVFNHVIALSMKDEVERKAA